MSTCAPNVQSVDRGSPASNGRGLVKSKMPYRSAKDLHRSRTEPFPGIGPLGDASVACQLIESDLIGGSKNSYIATLVERHSRYVMLVKVANKDTESVVSALIKSSKRLPRELYKSLTWDRGKELADHARLTMSTDVEVYFRCRGVLL